MGTFSNIKDKIKDKLDANDKIQEVHEFPASKFNGYPAAVIVPSENESDFETTTTNQRVYAFQVKILQETKNAGLQGAYTALYDLIDDVLDDFDKDQSLSGVTMPTGYTLLIVEAVPSSILPVIDLKNIIMTQITLRIRVEVDTQQIT